MILKLITLKIYTEWLNEKLVFVVYISAEPCRLLVFWFHEPMRWYRDTTWALLIILIRWTHAVMPGHFVQLYNIFTVYKQIYCDMILQHICWLSWLAVHTSYSTGFRYSVSTKKLRMSYKKLPSITTFLAFPDQCRIYMNSQFTWTTLALVEFRWWKEMTWLFADMLSLAGESKREKI